MKTSPGDYEGYILRGCQVAGRAEGLSSTRNVVDSRFVELYWL